MKKRIILLSLVLIMIPSSSIFADMPIYCSVPPFINRVVSPNVLIILDNSNSMDEDFYGNAVGSYSPDSKAIIAREVLINLINTFKDKMRIGIMTYRLGEDVEEYHIHNSPYFCSYEPKSYCPNPPNACIVYCQTGDLNAKQECEDACQSDNPSFDVNYFDEIIQHYPIGSEQRNRYCRLIYPKTQRMVNPTDPANYVYYKHAYPMYSESNLDRAFCYSTSYNPAEGAPWDYYLCYRTKTGTSDGYPDSYSDYWFDSYFVPTDTDYALGYADFGRRLSWVYVGRTWFNNSSPGDGYLQVPVDDVDNSQLSRLLNKLAILDEDGYMSCDADDKNSCSYIVNAGLTPTAGTLETARKYFEGQLAGYGSPIQYWCQKNFIVYVTDGLPSVDKDGNTNLTDPDALMPEVLNELDALRNVTAYVEGENRNFDIKTYIVGVALFPEAKNKLDEMAVHGGTDVDGHAYYADTPEQLYGALREIFTDILKRTSSGTAVSVLSEEAEHGASLLQAVFSPEETVEEGGNVYTLNWIGHLYNWWIYRGLEVAKTNIREDHPGEDKKLILDTDSGGDYVISFTFEDNQLKIKAYADTNGDGAPDNYPGSPVAIYTSLDQAHPVWEAGEKLKEKDPALRTIYTNIGGLTLFTETNWDLINDYLGSEYTDGTDDQADTQKLIAYIRGADVYGFWSRFFGSSVWKLGDIVYSTS
ncbi:MAG: hypothetical protein DRG83_16420 [Deltaproteobacteria bacterium]|nr:MAG: hypothetical protein DRG83_16420 [Deltaproteobacteria bacterium]